MNRFLYHFIFISILSIHAFHLSAQPQSRKFQHYSIADGLSQGRTNFIIQDNDGYMWFGSENGLNKFDGYSFKVYKHIDDDTTSLSGRKILTMFIDSKNRLWVGCGDKGGLNMYNKDRDNFTQFLQDPYDEDGLLYYSIRNISEDNKGNFFIGTNNGLYKFKPDSNEKGTWFTHNENNPNSLKANYIKTLLVDSNDMLWVGANKWLHLYDKQTNGFIFFRNDSTNPNSIGDASINFLCEYSKNNLLIGTWGDGINVLHYNDDILSNPKDVHIVKYKHDPLKSNSISNNNIFHIYKDKNKTIWLSTESGVNQISNSIDELLNSKPLSINIYKNNPKDEQTIDSDYAKCTYLDNSDVLWIGTTSGLNKSKNYKFSHYNQKTVDNGLHSNKVQVMFEQNDSTIWIGTSRGLSLFNKSSGALSSDYPDFGAVTAINIENNDLLWIGAWHKGLFKFNNETKEVFAFDDLINDSLSTAGKNPRYIYSDSKHNIWVSFWHVGLCYYCPNTQKLKLVKPTQFSTDIQTIFEDSKHNLWIGSVYGLGKISNPTTCPDNVEIEEIDSFKTLINCITEGHGGDLWIGTSKGLFRFNPADYSSVLYTENDGLPSNEIMGIVADKNENLWISSINGVSKFPISGSKKNGTHHIISNYNVDDGLQGREFLSNASLKCRSGEILFGGTNGFNIFNPNNIKDNETLPHVVFTDFQLLNKKLSIGEEIHGKIILPKQISFTNKIELSYKDNNFAIWFSAMHYGAPEQNQYKYKMDGLDNEWNNIGHEHKVSFTGLKPGKYELHVMASNCDNIWNTEPASLYIDILPPWWQTNLFRIAMFVIIIIAIILIIRFRTVNINKQRDRLEQTVELRTKELKDANALLKDRQKKLEQQTAQIIEMNNDLKVRNEEIESMAKQLHKADQNQLRFFTNISHEFRTPLTLILGPLEKILNKQNRADEKLLQNHLELMFRNTKRLFRLINQILDFRKLKQQATTISPVNNNIVEFVSGIVDAFMPMAEAKNIHLQIAGTQNIGNVETQNIVSLLPIVNDFWFDADIMEKILYNLVSNSIKYTPEGGEIVIGISVETLHATSLPKNQMVIKITDTGIGIKPENIENVFHRFFRSENVAGTQQNSSGIGLAYTKELVHLHKGEISVESEFGKGSIFYISFPFGLEMNPLDLKGEKPFNQTLHMQDLKDGDNQSLSLKYTKSMIDEEKIISNSPSYGTKESDSVSTVDEDENVNEKDTILIVEDNPDMQKYIANELSDTYKMLLANNGEEGFEIALKEIPDLIISDVMMPIMDGIELSNKLKNHENTSHIPIVLLTAKVGEENTLKGLKTGADDYLSKPFSTAILKVRIENLLKIRELLREKFSKSIQTNHEEFEVGSIDKRFLDKAVEIVENNMSDYDFSNDKFVSLLGYGRTMVYKKIKALTNKSVSGFIHSIRLKKAAQLLLTGEYNIGEVSDIVGYKHRESFYKYFTGMFGKSPSQFINENKT